MVKRNLTKSVLLLIIAYIILPLGAHDIWLTPIIINAIGLQMYTILCIILIIYLYNSIEGKTLSDKIDNVKKELKRIT